MKVLISMFMIFSSSMAMAAGMASIETGEKARIMFFELEKSKAALTLHTERLTEYTKDDTTCIAEERLDENGARTGNADFMCATEAAE